jgi:hypothetical protein
MPIKELPDDLRDDPSLKDFNDVTTLAKSFRETKAYVGSSLRPPGPDATPEAKKEFFEKLQKHAPHLVPLDDKDEAAQELVWSKLGRPKDAKEYEYKAPDGVELDLEPLREVAKAAGMTKVQFAKLAERAVNARAQNLEKARTDQAALKAEWGAAYAEKVAKASAAATKLGADEGVVQAIQAGTLPPKAMKTWDSIAKALGTEPSAEIAGQKGGGGKGALTPAEAEAQIAEIQAGKALWDKNDPMHAITKQRYIKLVEQATPG